MMSRAAKLVAVVGVGAMATACASGSASTSIEFQTGLGASDPTLALLAEVTAECEPEGVTIDLIPQTNTYEADMRTRLASGDVPDIWSTHGWSLLRYSDFLEPLDAQPWAASLTQALEPAMLDSDGSLFAMPINADIAGIVYNRAVIDDLGIDVEGLRTWSAFRSALGTVKDEGIIPIGSSSKDSWMAGNIADFMMSGAYDDRELEGLLEGSFDAHGYAKALDEIAQWRDEGYFNPDFSSATVDDLARSLATGDTAFVFVQNYFVSTVLGFDPEAEVGYFPLPSFVGDPYLVGGEGTAFGVSATTEHKEETLGYLDCLAEPDHLARLATSLGGIPGLDHIDADLGPLQTSFEKWVDSEAVQVSPYFDRVYLPNGMWDTMVTTTSAVITGQSDVDAAVEQVERQFDALYVQ